MKLTHSFLVAIATLVLSGTSHAQSPSKIAIVAHPSNTETRLTIEQVQDIYLGRTTIFPNGKRVVPVDQKDSSPTKAQFLELELKRNAGQVKSHWSKLIFSGQGVPPAVVGTDPEIKSWVARNPDSLGYLDASQVDGSVKVLLTVPEPTLAHG